MTQPSNESGGSETRRSSQLARIEELVRDLVGGDDTPRGLMREHLEAARFYLLGAMPSEYQFNLDLAEGLLSELDDKELQDRIRAFLRSQRSAVA